MWFPILVRWHLYSDSAPRILWICVRPLVGSSLVCITHIYMNVNKSIESVVLGWYSRFVFYLWQNRISANQKRCYMCKDFSHWLRPCSAIDRKQALVMARNKPLICCNLWMILNILFPYLILWFIARVFTSESVLWCIPEDFIDSKSTLNQAMAWCRKATSHYLIQWWSKSMMLHSMHSITKPQW